MKNGFDSKKYIKIQKEKIRERIKMFDKLYLEFGGKLIDDLHAARVLPGFEPDNKIKMLMELKEDVEIILCINAKDIERKKIRADFNISYDVEVIRLIEFLRNLGLTVSSVVITLYHEGQSIEKFIDKLKNYNIKTYTHTFTKGYPTDVDVIVSEDGYGANSYIKTDKKLVVVSAPGPCSGKLATCMSQLYHEYKKGVKAGYAKFETFPVWNLPLKHPVNVAYEAATADLNDKNMIDYFHLEKYNKKAVNYNRDLEMFPVLKEILHRITGKDIYYSPTDMGVNVIKDCITDDELIKKAATDEIIRRYYRSLVDYKKGLVNKDVCERIKILMNELGLKKEDRAVALKAIEKKKNSKRESAALQLSTKKIITGRETKILSPISSLVLNTVKDLTKIPDEVYLLGSNVLEPVSKLKLEILHNKEKVLTLEEVLLVLSICSVTNPILSKALDNLKKLRGTELHATYIITDNELKLLTKLGINVTCDPEIK